MRRLFFYGTILSGLAAAYLMYRRGESFDAIAKQAFANPVSTLAAELKSAL